MKDYKFTLEFNNYRESFSIWDEWNMADVELDVTYNIIGGSVHVCSVLFHGIEFIGVLMGLGKESMKLIEDASESDQVRLSVEKQYNNYPHLARPLTTEEKVEILKLK